MGHSAGPDYDGPVRAVYELLVAMLLYLNARSARQADLTFTPFVLALRSVVWSYEICSGLRIAVEMSVERSASRAAGASSSRRAASEMVTLTRRFRRERQVVGNYVVLKTLGTGSFGKVKLAEHKLTGCKVALKFISRKKVATPEMTERVTREIEYLRKLQHPHIIKLYEVVSDKDSIVMVIEYLTGELFDYIVKTGKMPEVQARWFFQQIIAAVDFCHANEIVHRDLKPENLLLDAGLNVKIADFGLSNVMRDGDFLKTSCGSPNYAAPEVISGRLYAGQEIDVWSCGVILYVMLCGRLPFDDDHIPNLFKKIQNGSYSTPPYLSPEARYLISRMLCVDSNKRAKISEIRAMPWFKKNLPAYLDDLQDAAAPRTNGHEHLGGSPEMPAFDDQGKPLNDASVPGGKEWIGAGTSGMWVEYEVVEDLCARSGGELTVEMVIQSLRESSDKDIWVSYQLCADSRRSNAPRTSRDPDHLTHTVTDANGLPTGLPPPMPPPNQLGRASSVRKPKTSAPPVEEDEVVESAPPQIKVLTSSLHPSMIGDLTGSRSSLQTLKHSSVSPLQAGRDLAITEAQDSVTRNYVAAGPIPSARPAKRSRARWHFGIRSRSPPMEVMLEIYKALRSLGFEWKVKTVEPTENRDDEEYQDAKHRKRREEEDRVKKAQELYLVETRCRQDDVEVRMDIQLYQIDEENYLVDFRNLGYRLLRRTQHTPEASSDRGVFSPISPSSTSISDHNPGIPRGRAGSMSTNADESDAGGAVSLDPTFSRATKVWRLPGGGSGVSSPFLFLDTACKLIVSLAVGAEST